MAEYIEREALLLQLEAMRLLQCGIPYQVRDEVLDLVSRQPAADVAPVRRGQWVKTSEYMPIYGCSICRERNLFRKGENVFSNYCPNCGAKMDRKENDNAL